VGYSGHYDQDGLRWPEKFYLRCSNLAYGLAQSDFAPTTQQKEAHEVLCSQLSSYKSEFNELINKDLKDFNNLLKDSNIPNIIVVKKP